jgi:hypothetical protein
MIEKSDWEILIKQFEAMTINSLMNIELYNNNIEYAKKKIAEFPVAEKQEDDKMPKELKETIAELTK